MVVRRKSTNAMMWPDVLDVRILPTNRIRRCVRVPDHAPFFTPERRSASERHHHNRRRRATPARSRLIKGMENDFNEKRIPDPTPAREDEGEMKHFKIFSKRDRPVGETKHKNVQLCCKKCKSTDYCCLDQKDKIEFIRTNISNYDGTFFDGTNVCIRATRCH